MVNVTLPVCKLRVQCMFSDHMLVSVTFIYFVTVKYILNDPRSRETTQDAKTAFIGI